MTDTAHGAQRTASTDGEARLTCFAPCPRGLEQPLTQELQALGVHDPQPVGGGVGFRADWPLVARLNRHTRLASRILVQLASRRYRGDKDLYKIASGVAWEDWFGPDKTLRVDTRASRASLRSLNMATLRVKDAIVDRLRDTTGTRPDIDTQAPQVRVFVFLSERQAILYLDTSGENLFKRGWRGSADKGAAPLKENLAAGLLALAGWQPGTPLYDPFCGSGTIVIEAAQQQLGLPAGHLRDFGLAHLQIAPDLLSQGERPGQAERVAVPAGIYASDIDPAIVDIARANAARAGVEAAIDGIRAGDFASMPAPCDTPGFIITNPPYGERMDFDADSKWGAPSTGNDNLLAIGQHLREAYPGWTVCMLSSDMKLPGRLGLKAARRIPLFNGPLETRLFVFEMRASR